MGAVAPAASVGFIRARPQWWEVLWPLRVRLRLCLELRRWWGAVDLARTV